MFIVYVPDAPERKRTFRRAKNAIGYMRSLKQSGIRSHARPARG